MNSQTRIGLLALQLVLFVEPIHAQDRSKNSIVDVGPTSGANGPVETDNDPQNRGTSTTPTGEPQYSGYDRVPAYIASPYPNYHRDYYRQTRYNPAYVTPPSNLPLFPERKPDWNPSRSLWYSARPAPWYFGHWYYPRYVRSSNVMPIEQGMNSQPACPPGSSPIHVIDSIPIMP